MTKGKPKRRKLCPAGTSGKHTLRAVSVRDTCVWNMQFSHVKIAISVTVKVKIISVVDFGFYLHYSSQWSLFFLPLDSVIKYTTDVKMLISTVSTHYTFGILFY